MNRIGVFTGKIYPEGTQLEDIEECAVLMSSERSIDIQKEQHKRCKYCHQCPEAANFRGKNSISNED